LADWLIPISLTIYYSLSFNTKRNCYNYNCQLPTSRRRLSASPSTITHPLL